MSPQVLPGLLLVFARRVDLSAGGQAASAGCHTPGLLRSVRWDSYFAPCVLAYAIGLGMALAANALRITVNGVQGQPALLYLVPATLGAVWWRAMRRTEVPALWHGSMLEPASSGDRPDPGGSYGSESGEYKPMLCGPL